MVIVLEEILGFSLLWLALFISHMIFKSWNFFFFISGSSLLLKMETSCDDHWSFFVVEKNTWLICDFCFWWYTLLLFLMINPKRTKKIMWKKNTRISVFGAHDLGKKGHRTKNPILRSARETQALSRLKNIHHPPPTSAAAIKKRTINYFLRYER